MQRCFESSNLSPGIKVLIFKEHHANAACLGQSPILTAFDSCRSPDCFHPSPRQQRNVLVLNVIELFDRPYGIVKAVAAGETVWSASAQKKRDAQTGDCELSLHGDPR
jgi:hypothetical protein